jgi:hypothetical protein
MSVIRYEIGTVRDEFVTVWRLTEVTSAGRWHQAVGARPLALDQAGRGRHIAVARGD